MNLATGAMVPLLRKLGELLLDEYNLDKKVKKGVTSLATELTMMHAALRKVGNVPRNQLDDQVRIWAGKVRELSYQMEDAVDAFMVRVEESKEGDTPTIKKKVKKFLKKCTRLFRRGKNLHQISGAIEEAQDLAKQLAELRQRYGLEMLDANVAAVAIDPRLMAMYKDVTELVGVDGPRDELVQMLIGAEEWKQQQLKIVSVVGFGGLGKTTLAHAVYENIKTQFDCGAFVTVSQNPDMKRVFKDMLYELDKVRYREIHNTARGEKQLLDELAEFLKNKRYFIVIDDIWEQQVWRFIKCAFSQNSLGSRLITTTRKLNVSEACCSDNSEDVIYRMKPLSDDDSQSLFYRRIFKTELGCPHELEEVSRGILKKCGGVPLAIITIASLLASNQKIKTKNQWYVLLNSIGRGLSEGDSLEEMQRILSFSYYDLPSHLKTCLLYLSIFPEDYEIPASRLIWRWIAEGFIQPEKQGTSMFELGEGYLNELVNRSLIQPVEIDFEGRAKCCLVHDMVLDLIRSLSNEENFVTILDGVQHSTPNSQRKIRRLSLQNDMEDTSFLGLLTTTSMSQVRSVTLFQPAINAMPSLSSFGVLRVLALGGCKMSESWYKINLEIIRNLLHLRYLQLNDPSIAELPVEIGELQYLQVLDVSGSDIAELPSSVSLLRHLLSLRLGYDTNLPVGMGKLVSLEELTRLRVDRSKDAKELGHLTELRVLEMVWERSDRSLGKVIAESLGNLRKLQILVIEDGSAGYESIVLDGWVPAPLLRRFASEASFSTLPTWVNSSLLPLLSSLNIWVVELREGDIQMIGRLPALRCLDLGAGNGIGVEVAPEEGFLTGADSFPCIRECRFNNLQSLPSMFPPGAMPMVETLMFSVRAWDMGDAGLDLGMGNLPSLKKVRVRISGNGPNSANEEVEAALRLAVDAHPSRPSLSIFL